MSNLQDRRAARVPNGKIRTSYVTAGLAPNEDPGSFIADNIYFKGGHIAKLFCIAALFIIPNLLVIRVLL